MGRGIGAKTTIAIMKTILAQDEVDGEKLAKKISEYLDFTPFYVQAVYVMGIGYFNIVSLFKKWKLFYAVPSHEAIALLQSIERNSFVGSMMVMVFKFFCTLTYFDDDNSTEHIGYKHLAHCR